MRFLLPSRLSCRVLGACLLGVLLVQGAPGSARADFVILKDGFILKGKVKREGKLEIDEGQALWMPQGFFMVDDVARRVVFSPSQVSPGGVDDTPVPAQLLLKTNRSIFYAPMTKFLPWLRDGAEAGEWNDRWDRTATLRTIAGKIALPEHLSYLSPYYARIDSTSRYRWTGYYLTRELGPEQVRTLLTLHPDLKEVSGKPEEENASRRFQVYHFYAQAGWYEQAGEELEHIARSMPGQKEKVDGYRTSLKNLEAHQLLTRIREAQAAGRHGWVQKQLGRFPEDGVDEKLLGQVHSLKEKYDAASDNLKRARQLLSELPRKVEPVYQRLFTEAADALCVELDYDHVLKLKEGEADGGRLDSFLSFAQQAERQEKAGSTPEQGPAQLLALAVTGWLLGGSAAEPKVELAQRAWRSRQFVLNYLQTPSARDRDALLADYTARKSDALAPEEMAQLIAFLPPAEPEVKLTTAPAYLELHTPAVGGQKVNYLVQLPPEYHHGRDFPVLFALRDADQKPLDALRRWGDLAAHHGYVLVAPEWGGLFAGEYRYSRDEHAAVLDVLRDLRRRFRIDSDRVFLAGSGQGGNMAYDIGMSHADEFAGVLPMSALPGPFSAYAYWRNAQYLPFYAVDGDYTGDEFREPIRHLFKQWVLRGYPALHVEYKGRGLEWFEGEQPFAFDWMNRKRRAHPLTQLGSNPGGGALGQEFQTMRQTDNHFYWLSTDAISERNVNDAARWDARVLAATLQARIGEGNQVSVQVSGLKQLTVWFGRGMIDFDKPVTIQVNLRSRWNGKATPKLKTLLDDFYQRGDRQRLFLARVDIDRP